MLEKESCCSYPGLKEGGGDGENRFNKIITFILLKACKI